MAQLLGVADHELERPPGTGRLVGRPCDAGRQAACVASRGLRDQLTRRLVLRGGLLLGDRRSRVRAWLRLGEAAVLVALAPASARTGRRVVTAGDLPGRVAVCAAGLDGRAGRLVGARAGLDDVACLAIGGAGPDVGPDRGHVSDHGDARASRQQQAHDEDDRSPSGAAAPSRRERAP
ncbi:MAG TPA: hypothetical protein VKG45_15935 [Actinomycetes bacterium]|nr:hypothetical protein [Actinomycetes bacterium]